MAFRNKCSQCSAPSKYCCPRCCTYTCSVICVNDHKKKLGCDGVRNKAAYVDKNNFTDMDLLNDYRFLEEAATTIDKAVRDNRKHCKPYLKHRPLPYFLDRFQKQARSRGTTWKVLPFSFSQRKLNTSIYCIKKNLISWRINWIFPQADATYTDNRVSEDTTISSAIEKYMNPDDASANVQQHLIMYHAAGYNGIKVLFQYVDSKRFCEVEMSETIKSNLKNKTIIEYPSFHVILTSNSDAYDIMESD